MVEGRVGGLMRPGQPLPFAGQLKCGRAEGAMRQTDLATASAVSRESLARLELGQQDLTFGTLWKLATLLKVTVGELVA